MEGFWNVVEDAPSEEDENFDPDDEDGDEEAMELDDEDEMFDGDDVADLPAPGNPRAAVELKALGHNRGPSSNTRAKYSLRELDIADIEDITNAILPMNDAVQEYTSEGIVYREFLRTLEHGDSLGAYGGGGHRTDGESAMEDGAFSVSEFLNGDEDEYNPASEVGSDAESASGRQSPHFERIQQAEIDELQREPMDAMTTLSTAPLRGETLWRRGFNPVPRRPKYEWLVDSVDERDGECGGQRGGGAAAGRSSSSRRALSGQRGGGASSSSSPCRSRAQGSGGGGDGASGSALYLANIAPSAPMPAPLKRDPTEHSPYITATQQATLRAQMTSFTQLVAQLLALATQSHSHAAEFDAAAIIAQDLRLRRDKARARRAATKKRVAQDAVDAEEDGARARTRAQRTLRAMGDALALNPESAYEIPGLDRLCAFVESRRAPRLAQCRGGFTSRAAALGDDERCEAGWARCPEPAAEAMRTLCPSGYILEGELAAQSRLEAQRSAAAAKEAELAAKLRAAGRGDLLFRYRDVISCESCSQFDSPPLI